VKILPSPHTVHHNTHLVSSDMKLGPPYPALATVWPVKQYRNSDVVSCAFIMKVFIFSFPRRNSLLLARVSSLSRLHDHTQTHYTRQNSSGGVISTSQRPLPDNTQQTNIRDPGGIRTHSPSKRVTSDPPLRTRGQWDRHGSSVTKKNIYIYFFLILKTNKVLKIKNANELEFVEQTD